MNNIDRIQENLKGGFYSNNPHSSAEDKAILAGEYGWIMGQLELILQRKASIWNTMRPNHKSDTACEREYQATSDGIDEQGLKLRAKGIERMMSALSSLIKVAEGESKNIF